jgi:hypothetical protein
MHNQQYGPRSVKKERSRLKRQIVALPLDAVTTGQKRAISVLPVRLDADMFFTRSAQAKALPHRLLFGGCEGARKRV